MLRVLSGALNTLAAVLVGGTTMAWASHFVGRWLGLAPILILLGAVGIFVGLAVHFAADHVLVSLRSDVEGLVTWLAQRADENDQDSESENEFASAERRSEEPSPPRAVRRSRMQAAEKARRPGATLHPR